MRRSLGKLSRLDIILLVLVALVLGLSLFFFYSAMGDAKERDRLATGVKAARRNLEESRQEVDLRPLQAEKEKLVGESALLIPLRVEGGEVSLALWKWAVESGVTLLESSTTAGPAKVAESDLFALKEHLTSQGKGDNMARFLRFITSSPYAPGVDNLSLEAADEAGLWDMVLDLVIYAQGQ